MAVDFLFSSSLWTSSDGLALPWLPFGGLMTVVPRRVDLLATLANVVLSCGEEGALRFLLLFCVSAPASGH